jgi:anti-sigma B factor antagonist
MSSSQDIPDAAAQEERPLEEDQILAVRRETVGTATVLQVVGEIDTDTAPLFREHLATARRDTTAAAPLIVDLSGVTYMASPGLSVLIEAHNEHRRLHTRLLVVAGSRATRVPIMTTGLHAQLDVVITLAQALPSTM